MFRTISIAAFVVTFVGIAIHCLVFPSTRERRWHPMDFLRKLVHFVTLFFLEQKLSLVGICKKLLYLLAIFCFIVLAVTGFYPLLVLNEHISGYLMMIHATFAPVFAICLAVLAVMWARNNRLVEADFPLLQRIIRRVTRVRTPAKPISGSSHLFQKIAFWLIVFLALPLILSIICSMFPLFGTHWQELLLAMHRYTALVFALVAIVHAYLVVRVQMKQ
jgi:cytochrome b subunit of formate dehydrogenase